GEVELVVSPKLGLVGQVLDPGAGILLQLAEEALDLGLLLLVHLDHLLGQVCEEVVDDVRLIAFGALGKAEFYAGENLIEVPGGVEVLEFGYQGRALGLGGGEGDAADGESKNVL
ncbi:MAG: hypothetical protein U9N48_02870, partial [Euryarchaeota archaeon]|nr:hypothetical protein [Euryarchaeota archaeon]